jgi:hypothetical protein
MSDNFFRLNKGLNLNPQTSYGSSDPAGTDGDIYYNDVLAKFRKFQNGFWTDLDTNSGGGGGSPWVAQELNLPAASTGASITFTAPQPDTSYVVFAIMENLVDPNPQFQQVEVVSKTTTGFNVKWNVPLDTANYIISFVVPPRWFTYAETPIGAGQSSVNVTFPFAQATSSYPVIGMLQNLVDANPQFQSVLVTQETTSATALSWNVPTGTANYKAVTMLNGSAQISVGSGATSVTIPLPVDYGTSNYGIVVTAQNLVDAHPQYMPLLVTAKTANSVTVSWNVPTSSANYVLTCYAISATA